MRFDYLSNCKLLRIGLIGLLSFSLFWGTTVAAEVYWAARDLKILPVGNHHFILVVPDNPDELPEEIQKMLVDLGGGKKGFTLAASRSPDGRLQFESNNDTDRQSVREHFDPEEHVTWLPDYDLEKNEVEPPKGMTETEFIERQVQLAQNYETNEAQNNVEFDTSDQNCAAWANTMFKIAGVGEHEREEAGDFFGFDQGEEYLLDESLFTHQPP